LSWQELPIIIHGEPELNIVGSVALPPEIYEWAGLSLNIEQKPIEVSPSRVPQTTQRFDSKRELPLSIGLDFQINGELVADQLAPRLDRYTLFDSPTRAMGR
jgi:hypothetical protein